MKKNRQRRNLIIFTLCAVVVFMSAGYAYLQQDLNVSGTATIKGNFSVHFNNITYVIPSGSIAVNNQSVLSATKDSAIFDTNLNKPGDSIIYTLEVINDGEIDAVVDKMLVAEQNINENTSQSSAIAPISYVVEGLTEGATVPAGTKATFTVTVVYNQENNSLLTGATQKKASVKISYKQAIK